MNARKIHDVLENHGKVCHVLPDEEILVLAGRIVDEAISELRLACTAMFVDNVARRREEAFPSTLPRLVREVGILDIKGMVKHVESTDREILVPIDGT